MRIQATARPCLQQVLDVVEARADDSYRRRIAERIASWRGAHEAAAKRRAAAAANKGSGALNPVICLPSWNGKLAQDDIVLNEAIRNGPMLQEQLSHAAPKLVGPAGGGLGFQRRHGAGIELAQPHRRVVQIIGDGAFYFSSPDSVHATAQQYELPILRGARQRRLASREICSSARLPDGRCRGNQLVPVQVEVGSSG